jgi:hypothetical protein
MGQQQLLLLVLGIVIVGIAVVAGIQAFSEGRAKAQQDAAVSDAMRIISDTQAWKLKPQAFGGGDDGTESWQTVNLKALGYPVETSSSVYVTTNGCFSLSGAAAGATVGINAAAAADSSATTSCSGDKIADVLINGTGSGDIGWTYAN